MNINIKSIFCFALLTALVGVSSVEAQNKKGAAKKRVQYVDVASTIVDEEGNPIENAEIITREGAATDFSNDRGEVAVTSVADGILLVEAMGYEDVVIEIKKSGVPKQITMKKVGYYESSKDVVERYDGATTQLSNFTGAVGSVEGTELISYADYNLSNALQGRIAGLVARQDAGTHGSNTSTITIRGQHRDETNTVLVLVDGFVRDYNDILPEEIETITVYKDAVGKILYGSRGANGVLAITTKRGTANKRIVNLKAETGVSVATRSADYLNSYEYASLYNEACVNDGLSPLYSNKTLEGYKSSTGANDLLYPDVDYSDYFLSNTASLTKATMDMAGGNDRIKYSVVGGLLLGNGFEAVGTKSHITRVNIRGSLDVKITDELSFVANAAARYETRKYGSLDSGTIYSRVASYLPNEAPLTIAPEDIASAGVTPMLDGSPIFGASTRVVGNLLADMVYGGNTEYKYNMNQTNLGLRFDLNEHVEGLTFGGDFFLDNSDSFQLGQTDVYATYAVTGFDAEDQPKFTQTRKLNLADADSRESFASKRNIGYRGMIGYVRSFGDHDIDANAMTNYTFQETAGKNQFIVNTQTSLRANYTYKDTYSAEATFALLGSNRFSKENRYFLSRAFGASAILSKMDFLKDSSFVDYLKVKASYGVLGYDAATSYLLHKQLWANTGGTTSFGEANVTPAQRVNMVHVASDVQWENSTEYNVGVEGIFFGGRLSTELNYFHETRKDMIESITSDVANILGGYIEVDNVGSIRNQGFEAQVAWSQRKGDLNYRVGFNASISKNKILEWDDYNYPDLVQRKIGYSTSVMKGYEAIGLFGRDVPLEGHPTQTFGAYGEGDMAYKDQNGDNIIDSRDQVILGDSFPTGVFGIDFDINYKGWGLYALGTAEVGGNAWLNNSFYQNDGLSKYSTAVIDRYHKTNNPDGVFPRLTTLKANNNFVNSSFWMSSASFFRLKSTQLSYTFNFKSTSAPINKLKLFVNGTNLFVLSPIKDLDPEALSAGVTTCPIARTITGGVCVTF